MSNSLRDLFVSVQFDDSASKTLNQIDGKMDDLERGFVKFGVKVDKSGQGLKSMGTTGTKATEQISGGLKKSEKEAGKLADEIDDSQAGLKKAGEVGGKATDKIEKGFDKSGKEAKDFKREVDNSSNALSGLKGVALKVGGALAGIFAIDKIKDFAVSGIELAAGTKALNSQFDQVFTGLESQATSSLTKIANDTSILPDRLKGSFVQMAAFAKTTGVDTAAALSLTERATLAAADSAAFYDRSIEDVMDNLQSLLKGNFENDAALGISVTETTRNAAAMKLFGNEFKNLTEAQKQLTLLQMVEDGNQLAGAVGQAAREADGFENVVGNLKSAWDGLKGTMMAPFLEVVTGGMMQLTEKMQGIDAEALGNKLKTGFDSIMQVAVPTFEALKKGFQWFVENKDTIITIGGGLVGGFAAFKTLTFVGGIVTGVVGGIKTLVTTFKSAGTVMKVLSVAFRANPFGLIATGIGLAISAGIAIYKNWDTIKEHWHTFTGDLKHTWGVVSDFFKTSWENIKSGFSTMTTEVGGLLSQVGGFFVGLKDKAFALWEMIKQNPMLLSVVGPIGAVIGAGISLYQNWDTVKTKAGELWATAVEKFAGIKEAVSDFVSPALGWFGSLKQKWDDLKSSLANFKMPEWMSSIGGVVSSVAGKVRGLVQGSHATGLERVPHDGYIAELHKGEAVLTAQQSNSLRSMGVLGSKSDGTPTLNQSGLATPVPVGGTGTPVTTASTPSVSITMPVELIIQGNADSSTIIELQAMLKQFEGTLSTKVRKIIEDLIRSQLAGLEG